MPKFETISEDQEGGELPEIPQARHNSKNRDYIGRNDLMDFNTQISMNMGSALAASNSGYAKEVKKRPNLMGKHHNLDYFGKEEKI
jgi:hypothetical protein